MVNVRVSIS